MRSSSHGVLCGDLGPEAAGSRLLLGGVNCNNFCDAAHGDDLRRPSAIQTVTAHTLQQENTYGHTHTAHRRINARVQDAIESVVMPTVSTIFFAAARLFVMVHDKMNHMSVPEHPCCL